MAGSAEGNCDEYKRLRSKRYPTISGAVHWHSQNLTQSELEDIAKGLNAGARQYGAYVVGGDTGEASDLIISVHLYGVSQKNGLMLRKGTKPGDILAVTGTFGKTSAGLKLLLNPDTCRAPGGLRERL